MNKEKLIINLLGLKVEAENPTKKTILIVGMVLLFIAVITLLK